MADVVANNVLSKIVEDLRLRGGAALVLWEFSIRTLKQTWRNEKSLSNIRRVMERKSVIVEKLPQDALAPKDAAAKYRLTWGGLRAAISRKKIVLIRYGSREYLTDREMERYLKTRNALKIPKKYRLKL